jgi:CheY-like chemotaxis protein
MLLSRKGFDCDIAENGKEAVDMVINNSRFEQYKIIIMDNIMPVMDGGEAIHLLRNAGFTNKIIGLTGNVLDDEKHSMIKAGADEVLHKPLQAKALDRILMHAA